MQEIHDEAVERDAMIWARDENDRIDSELHPVHIQSSASEHQIPDSCNVPTRGHSHTSAAVGLHY